MADERPLRFMFSASSLTGKLALVFAGRFCADEGAGVHAGGIRTVAARVSAALALSVLLLSGALGAAPTLAQGIGITVGGPWGGVSVAPKPGKPTPGPYAPYETQASPGPTTTQGGMDANGAVNMLRGRGFSQITVVKQRGATIILEANGPRGERVQLIVDGASGAISGMKVIGFGDKRY
jgi:hypothetical protein